MLGMVSSGRGVVRRRPPSLSPTPNNDKTQDALRGVQLGEVVVDLVLQNLGREEEHLRGGGLVGEEGVRHLY